MRSVVVVLPASMWAMIPMLRVRSSGYSRISGAPALPSTALSVGFWRNSGSLAIAFTTNPSNPPTDIPISLPSCNRFLEPFLAPISATKRPGDRLPAGRLRCTQTYVCETTRLLLTKAAPCTRVRRKRTFQVTPTPACRPGASPPVVRERLILFRHLVQFLPPLHGSTDPICCIHQFTGQPGLHRPLPPCP